ncbi:family 43 glycosylhydrolase [Microbacterium sp. CFH 31415]|uniref:immunoglobulin-like domain-containing protein n=1 Tax=Microbacterium sp. CFH 31415 TaxID=2921732 RepID=UPI001F138B63|nr:immunoglobulin-like domain-containing protein [Microbacterium sp. CFH 31415]MCH6231173.1 family 43 glycosylhydrolase [Microbacterium sp. CFH 31415]
MTAPTRIRRRALGIVAAASVVAAGLLPAATAATAADPLRDSLVAEYLFDEASGDAVRNTADGDAAAGDPFDAVVRNYVADQRSEAGALRFTGGAKTSTGNWVELPDDILAGAGSATVSIDVKSDPTMLTSNHFLWNIGNDATQQYWFANVRGPRSGITVGSAAGEKNGTAYGVTANRWHSLTAVIDADADTLTFYTDGQRAGVIKTTLTPADITQTLNTIGRAPWPDTLFKGSIGAFRVYDRALSDTEVVALSELDAMPHAAELATASSAKLASLDLGDTTAVTADLQLVTLHGVRWASSDPAVIAPDGTVTRPAPGQPATVVTLTASATTRGQAAPSPRSFTVTVPALAAADLAADRDALRVPESVRGNLTLPARGAAGSPIQWESSDEDVITDAATGAAAAGVVTRPEWGSEPVEVTLTATIGDGPDALTREFAVTVEPLPRAAADSRYLFAYFTADTIAGENIFLAASQGNSAMTWDVLGGGAPLVTSTFGEMGLRDPFILRAPEGDRFYLIATDLSIGRNGSWDRALDQGSAHLEIWQSTDLRTWSQQRHVKVSGPNASMTWAPEAYWDAAAGEFVVYWSSRVYLDGTRPYDKAGTPNSTYSKVMYATTRDFVTFSPAKVWEDAGDRIDSTMIEDDGTFYRFTKEVTGCVDIVQESSGDMHALTVPGDYAWQTDASCISKTARNTTRTTEGPTIFRANAGDTSLPAGVDEGFYLFVDDFTGVGYLPLFTESLAAPQWRTVTGALPKSRHGSVLPVTLNQWEAAKGAPLTKVATEVELDGVEPGDTLRPGDALAATVTAADGGAVAGFVRFTVGHLTVDAPIVAKDGAYVAEAVVPETDAAGEAVQLSAAFADFDVLAGSAASTVDVMLGDPPVLEVEASVSARCVSGKVVQVVTVSNADDVAVSATVTGAYGSKTFASIAAGKSSSASFTTRLASIPTGSISLTASAAVAGSPVIDTTEVTTAPASCG